MFVFPKYSGKSQSANTVYLVAESDKIQINGLAAEKVNHLKSLFKEGNFALFNEFGRINIFCKFEDLKKDSNKEKLRDLGHKVYEATKGLCDNFHITGGSTQAQELFIEGFALSSYEFSKYFTKPKKQKLSAATFDNKAVNITRIQHIADVTLWARDLINEPVSYLNAEQLANEIVKKCKGTSVKSEVLGQAKI
ncbi:MAG: hypothetical protein JNJ99_15045 [Crocinitomicaceae bacterium]|nr:hypothetical protein [Crocinitomicaceae bacterium]